VFKIGDNLRKDTVSYIKRIPVTVRLRAICDKLEKAFGDFQVPLLAENGIPVEPVYNGIHGDFVFWRRAIIRYGFSRDLNYYGYFYLYDIL
jgi:hypothetical protein